MRLINPTPMGVGDRHRFYQDIEEAVVLVLVPAVLDGWCAIDLSTAIYYE